MRLNALRLVNFRQYLDATIRFDDGLTGIIGPNGAGKSTILEAIAWALYGNPAVRGTREGIRSLRAGARAGVRVELDFELGGHRYEVKRGLTSAEVFLDGATAPIANSITSVGDLLRRRLAMTKDEFFNTYFTGQKELAVMAQMGPTERSQFLSRVLGYERLRSAQTLAKDRRKEVVAEAMGLKQGMGDPIVVASALEASEARVRATDVEVEKATTVGKQARAALEALRPTWERAQRDRDQLQAVLADLRVAEANSAARARDLERIDRDRAEIAAAGTEMEAARLALAPLPALRASLAELEKLARDDGRRRTLVESETALAADLTRLRARQEQLATVPARHTQTMDDLEQRRENARHANVTAEQLRAEWTRETQHADTRLQELRRQVADERAQRDRLVTAGETGTCPMCERPLADHYRTVLDALDERIEQITADGKFYKARMAQLATMPPELSAAEDLRAKANEAVATLERASATLQSELRALKTLNEDIQARETRRAALAVDIASMPVAYDAARHDVVRRDTERLAAVEARAQRLEAVLDREPQLLVEQQRIVADLAGARVRMTELSAQRDALTPAEDAHAQVSVSYERANAAVRSAELAFATAQAEQANARAVRASAVKAAEELARAENRLAALTRDRLHHEELDRAYTDLRADLNAQLRPEIAEIATSYLIDLTDGRYTSLELDDEYKTVVLADGVPMPVVSGGEEDIANLVLRLAISQMIADRAGQPFSLLVLDEVFGSLDEVRRANLLGLLKRLRDRFEQVIVITHIEEVREWLDQVITVNYDDKTGTSRVESEASRDGDHVQMAEAGAA